MHQFFVPFSSSGKTMTEKLSVCMLPTVRGESVLPKELESCLSATVADPSQDPLRGGGLQMVQNALSEKTIVLRVILERRNYTRV